MAVKVLTVVTLLAVAQLIPSCGDRSSSPDQSSAETRPTVIGWVDEKRVSIHEPVPYLLVIGNREYGVPYEFWLNVGIRDLVKLQGDVWSVVRRAGRR